MQWCVEEALSEALELHDAGLAATQQGGSEVRRRHEQLMAAAAGELVRAAGVDDDGV